MSQPWLSDEQALPLWLPLAFFAAAMAWLCLLALGLAVAPAIDANRFAPLVVAFTHLLALGVLGNLMFGALLQLLAVLAAIPLRRPARMLLLVLLPWQVGCALLCTGCAQGFAPRWLSSGAICLALALAVLLGHGIAGLHRTPARDSASRGMLRALTGLMLAAGLGLALVTRLSGHADWPLLPLLHSHVLWAGVGWLLALLIAISQTVLPMFLITPTYPRATRWLSAGLLPLLALISVGLFTTWSLGWLCHLLLWLAVCGYGIWTWRLLRASRRPQDPARAPWLRAMAYLLTAATLALAASLRPDWPRLPLLAGWLWLAGLGLGVMLAMLGKIIPFLCWLQLKALQPARGSLPSTHAFLSERAQCWLGWLHGQWLLCGLFWCLAPAASQGWLAASTALLALALLLQAVGLAHRYRHLQRQILATRATPPGAVHTG